MEFDNKTILVSGLLIGAIIAMYLQYEQIANVIFGGLIGYLSKDHLDAYLSNRNNDEIIQDDVNTATLSLRQLSYNEMDKLLFL